MLNGNILLELAIPSLVTSPVGGRESLQLHHQDVISPPLYYFETSIRALFSLLTINVPAIPVMFLRNQPVY
jgi:hypothetical protein